MIVLPVANSSDQRFSFRSEQRRVTMRLRFSTSEDRWSCDLSVDDQIVLEGQRLTVNANILAAYGSISIGAIFVRLTSGDLDREAFNENRATLYHATDGEVNAAIQS